jgi:hypothetical protein
VHARRGGESELSPRSLVDGGGGGGKRGGSSELRESLVAARVTDR